MDIIFSLCCYCREIQKAEVVFWLVGSLVAGEIVSVELEMHLFL